MEFEHLGPTFVHLLFDQIQRLKYDVFWNDLKFWWAGIHHGWHEQFIKEYNSVAKGNWNPKFQSN